MFLALLHQSVGRLKLLLIVMVILCHTSGVDCRSKPRITGVDDIYKTISVPSSTPLVLTCVGDDDITWIPHNRSSSRVTQKTSAITIDPSLYESILTIEDSVYKDTGSFRCAYKNVLNEFTDVYVFVKDPKNLLLPISGSASLVSIRQDRESIIPCLPTSQDVDVTLWRGTPGEIVETNNVDVVFDPTKGFIISFATIFYNGEFHCLGKLDGHSMRLNFTLFFMGGTTMVPTPHIDFLTKYAVINSNFQIFCSVKSPKSVYIYLNWTYPDSKSSRIEVGTDTTSEFQKNYKETKNTLKITSVQATDQGTYTCTATDHNSKSKSTSEFLQVRKEGDYSIQLTTDFDTSEPFLWELNSDTNITWVVRVDAFPSTPEITWYKHNNIIKHGTKYKITNGASSSILTIMDVNGADSGDYVVKGTIGSSEGSLPITLLVLETPNVTLLLDPDIYRTGEIFTVKCSVVQCPPSNISWEWSPCRTPYPCSKKYHELMESEDNQERITEHSEFRHGCHVISMLSGRVAQPGHYKCNAVSEKGMDSREIGLFVTEFADKFNIQPHKRDLYEQDDLQLTCYASIFYYSTIQWFWKPHNMTSYQLVTNSSNVIMTSLNVNYSIIATMEINPVVEISAGTYKCRAKLLQGGIIWHENTTTITVRKATLPIMVETNMNNSQYQIFKEDNFEFICRARGSPNPTIYWYLNGTHLHQPNNSAMHFEDNKSKLIITRVLPTDTGNYVCVVSNRAGNLSRNATLIVLDESRSAAGLSTGALSGIIVVIVVFILATITFAVFLGRKIYRERKEQRELEQFQHMLFDQGDSRIYDPMLPLEDQVDCLPYDKRWEFPKERLKLDKVIGQGAFGRVYRGEASGIVADEEVTIVAVKMLKERADWEQRKALMQELKIMIHLGRHLNVVNVLGAVTQNLHKGEFQVIVEYCRFGNLRHYLLRHRDNFIDQINTETGEIDMAVRHRPHESVFFTAPVRASKHMRSSASNTSSVCMSPTEDISMTVTTNGEPGENHRVSAATAKSMEARTVTTYHLICYAYQICSGMQYLASKKLVHRDLALRNILLAEGDIVKICDFGLTKDMYHKNYYRKKGKGALPIKWMAVESIGDRVFSSESDVWSFGIVLWELCTLGGNPYPGLEVDELFYRRLLNGYRMEKPQLSPQSLYELMIECWQREPKNRPSFDDIYLKLGDLLEETTVQHYHQLNDDYLKPENVVGNPYYLSMLPSGGDYYNEQQFEQPVDNEDYIDRDEKPIGINAAKGTVNYANLPSPTVDTNPDLRTASYGDKNRNHQEIAPMLASSDVRHLKTPPSAVSGDSVVSTNPFVYSANLNSNNTNPFLPNFSSSSNGPYLDMGSRSNLLDNDITLREQNRDSDVILGSPPPRGTSIVEG